MTLSLADRLSRALTCCYPRRWRERYGEEMLAVLDQHRAGTRTVLNLAAGALSTHLDPSFRLAGTQMTRIAHLVRMSVAVAASIVVFLAAFLAFVKAETWKDGHWHVGLGGINSMAFSPDQRILLTAASGPSDGLDTLWNVSNPARPRQLSRFEGGAPAAFAPSGHMIVTVSYQDQPILWNVTNLSKPTRIATMNTGDSTQMWGEAFSPSGDILAAAYADRIYLWDVADPAKPRLLRILADPVVDSAPEPCGQSCSAPFQQGDLAFSPDGRLLAAAAGHDQIGLWNVTDPGNAIRIAAMSSRSGFVDALAFSPSGDRLAAISVYGTVTMFSLADPARPARVATMKTLTARQITATACLPGGCAPMFTVEFAPDGRTLTAVANLSPQVRPQVRPAAQVARDYAFVWNVVNPGSVSRIAVLSHAVAISGGPSLPLLNRSGRIIVTGASSGFAVTLWAPPWPALAEPE